jgi:hypothetical protein
MKRLLSLGAAALLAVGCGGKGNGSSSNGGSGSGNGGTNGGSNGGSNGGGQYDTLQGSFSSHSGIAGTFSGAMRGVSGNGLAEWTLVGSFDDGSVAPAVTVSNPAGQHAIVGIAIENVPGALAATTYVCSASSPTILIDFNVGGVTYAVQAGGSQGTCSVTFDAPSLVEAPTVYFAHGSMTATLIGALPDGGSDTGTMSATW